MGWEYLEIAVRTAVVHLSVPQANRFQYRHASGCRRRPQYPLVDPYQDCVTWRSSRSALLIASVSLLVSTSEGVHQLTPRLRPYTHINVGGEKRGEVLASRQHKRLLALAPTRSYLFDFPEPRDRFDLVTVGVARKSLYSVFIEHRDRIKNSVGTNGSKRLIAFAS